MIGNTKQTVSNVCFLKQHFPKKEFPMQVGVTCAQFETTCAQFRTVACNGIPIGNPTKTQSD